MSAMYRNNSRSSGKKKFGKNLNSVTKAPAPPNPSTANARTSSSRNGLLLLSTKRGSSTGLLSTKNKDTSSSPSSKAPSLGIKTESYSSAHDALLGAVIGASRMTDTQQPPDAWGVSTEKQPEASDVSDTKEDAVEVNNENASEAADIARERAEQRRAQADEKFNEQKERAAERLRELEEKMSSEKAPVITQRPPDSIRGAGMDFPAARPRTLFDPNRPYSLTVGGKATEEEVSQGERRASPTDEYSRSPRGADEQPLQQQPVIHVPNYESRDRGERNNNVGPRMLFDPKSGSMVAAPSRDDGISGGRGKKGKAKGRKERGARDDGEENGTKLRKGRGRTKEDRRDKRRVMDEGDATPKDESKKRGGKVQPAENRLPRTCGVLYRRDENGNLVCADDCDGGDQGYGAHSVPGGRVRNPIEYSKWVAQEKAMQLEGVNGLAYGVAGFDDDQGYYATQEAPEPEPEMVQKEIDWVKPDEKIELVTGSDDSPTLQATASTWVPSQATASTWVPSQAALAAAAAAKEEAGSEKVAPKMTPTDDDAEDTDDDEDHPAFVGLGFDPTENMDSVMQSPSVKTKTRQLDPVGLSGLTLNGPLKEGEAPTRNIFAFGSSATWGGGAESTDWAALTEPKSQGVANEGQDKAAGAASFLSLSSGNPWGTSGLASSSFGAGAMPGPGSAGKGSTGD